MTLASRLKTTSRSQPRPRRKEDPSLEERRARAHWRAPRLHVAEEPELRRAPSRPMVQDYAELRSAPYLAKLPLMPLVVLLVEKALENH